MILIGLLFRLGIEQRVRDLGLFGAVGFTARQVQRQMLIEGLVTAVLGGLIGMVLAVAYAKLMIYGLTHWWVGAVGTKNLILDVRPVSLIVSFLISLIAALVSIWWALGQIKRLSLREQLAGVTEPEVDLATQEKTGKRVLRRAIICTLLSLVLSGCVAVGLTTDGHVSGNDCNGDVFDCDRGSLSSRSDE